MSRITERLLFAAHLGQCGNRPVGVLMTDHCLPIACSHSSWAGHEVPYTEAGFYALWESVENAEDFFSALAFEQGIESLTGERPSGLYVYEVDYSPAAVPDAESWLHLQEGKLRRPTIEELAPLTSGEAPWGGIVI